MAKDLSVSLSADKRMALQRKIATMRRQNHLDVPPDPDRGDEAYPKMLYEKGFVDAQRRYKDETDPKLIQKAHDDMKRTCKQVWGHEEELEYLEDGWRTSPADLMDVDPRIPLGREGRRSAREKRLSVADELERLELRMAELKAEARSMREDVANDDEPIVTPPIVLAAAKPATRKPAGSKAKASVRRPPPPASHVVTAAHP